MIDHNAHAMSLETSKIFFCEYFIPQSPGIKVIVGIRIKIPENTFYFLKCHGIKNYF